MLQKGQFRRTSELPVAIIWSPVVHFCPDRIEIEDSASRNPRKALSFQPSSTRHVNTFPSQSRFSKVRRRCGRGRHGRPWPCEWDVGREPDRDERSEPPTAAPPPGAIQTMKRALPNIETITDIPVICLSGRCYTIDYNALICRLL